MRAVAAAWSMAPKTIMRGGGAYVWMKTDTSCIRRSPWIPYHCRPVAPWARRPRASSVTAASRPSSPNDPSARSAPTTRRALAPVPSGRAVATATGSPRATVSPTSRSQERSAGAV